MNFFRNIPIKWKIITIVLVISFLTLTLALGSIIIQGIVTLRGSLVQDTVILARITGLQSASALIFNDPENARETLKSLAVKENIDLAVLYTPEEKPFVFYNRPDFEPEKLPLPPFMPGAYYVGDSLAVYSPIQSEQTLVGYIYLKSNLKELRCSVARMILISSLIILVALVVAFIFSSFLQRLISRPIEKLTSTALRISREKNYGLRAKLGGKDELGELVRCFNEMLNEIQLKDDAVQSINKQLHVNIEELGIYAQELERSNKELDDFAYIASHDLKEPLRGIHNYSTFLLEDYSDKLDAEGQKKLGTLLRLTKRMEQLIESLLHFSRIGRIDLSINETDLNEVLSGTLDSLMALIETTKTKVSIHQKLPILKCDPVFIGEVFQNLISNAIKYNDKTEKKVEIGITHDPLTFYVKDNGIGIPEKHKETIFKIFKRLHGRTMYGGGTGVGLTIIKKIIERHGGKIWVESTLNEGTVFYFTLAQN